MIRHYRRERDRSPPQHWRDPVPVAPQCRLSGVDLGLDRVMALAGRPHGALLVAGRRACE